MTFPPEVWDDVLRRLTEELPEFSVNRWIHGLEPAASDDGLDLICPSDFHLERVRDYFLPVIQRCVVAATGGPVELRLRLGDSQTEASVVEIDAAQRARESILPESSASETPAVEARTIAPPPTVVPASQSLAATARTPEVAPRGGQEVAIGRAIAGAMQPRSGKPRPRARRGFDRSALEESNAGNPPRKAQSAASTAAEGARSRRPLAPLTFDTFTVGPCNALAREAAAAMAAGRQASLDQLYIVSAPGLGKTHLARAVMSESRRSLGERARYTTAESFTNEFTSSIRNNQMEKFKRRYRNDCDLLIVEDIQLLGGRVATQLEFFHSVQHVLDCGGRVVLTGERFPHELSELDPRVRARITSGFVAELDFPDAVVRRNILRAKAAHGGVRLPDDCLDLLVETVKGSVRELEGALIQLVTTSSLLNRPIDRSLAEDALHRRVRRAREQRPRALPVDVINVVATFFQTSPDAMASRSRRRDVLLPRQLAMYLCRRYTEASLTEIGRGLNRDHPSVTNAIRRVERALLEKVQLRYQVEALIGRLDELGYAPIHPVTPPPTRTNTKS